MKNTKEDFDKRIAVFMSLGKYNGYWKHPGKQHIVSEKLGFSDDWEWLMPVVEKIQTEYHREALIKEYEKTEWGFSSTITIYGHSWVHYYWHKYEAIKEYIENENKKAARYGETYVSEHHFFASNKFEAVYECVCRFIEWWEKQNK